jgi:hypothetical protein
LTAASRIDQMMRVNFFPRGVPRGGGGGLLLSHMTGSKARHLHGTESADVQERTSE